MSEQPPSKGVVFLDRVYSHLEKKHKVCLVSVCKNLALIDDSDSGHSSRHCGLSYGAGIVLDINRRSGPRFVVSRGVPYRHNMQFGNIGSEGDLALFRVESRTKEETMDELFRLRLSTAPEVCPQFYSLVNFDGEHLRLAQKLGEHLASEFVHPENVTYLAMKDYSRREANKFAEKLIDFIPNYVPPRNLLHSLAKK
ncbi:MAG: hypothetical protein AABX11_05040 [Nanoarchaeota archaeon]